MVRVIFLNSLWLLICLSSCQTTTEKAQSIAYGEFNYQINDLQIDTIKFENPKILDKDKNGLSPRKNHILIGWKAKVKTENSWIYVEVDTTFNKEPSVTFSDGFMKHLYHQ